MNEQHGKPRPKLYHEKQSFLKRQCAIHSINNLLQEKI